MISIEIKLLKSKKQVLPAAILILALLFMAFVDYWFGAEQKQLAGAALAEFISIRASQATLPALFFIFWMIQRTIHLVNTGYYKMLLIMGWARHKLFIYSLLQVCFYAFLFMLLYFFCYAILSFFNVTNPIQLLLNTDYNAVFSQFLFLSAVGFIALTVAFIRPNPLLILPVLVYWLLEGWLVNFIQRKFESSAGEILPLQAFKQIISANLLDTPQTIVIAAYTLLFLYGLHFSIQKRMFV